MNPLTVTWAPHLYTQIGWENFTNWIHVGGVDNVLFTPNGKLHRLLTKLAFENLTLAPIENDLIDHKQLTHNEKNYLFRYNILVYEKLSPFLNKDEKKWLASFI